MLQQWFVSNGKLPAIWIEDVCITYQELWQKIQDLALVLKGQGIKGGDRAAFVAETNANSIIALFALLEIGASPCLLSTRLPPEKIPSYLEAARASFFLVDVKTGSIEKRKRDLLR